LESFPAFKHTGVVFLEPVWGKGSKRGGWGPCWINCGWLCIKETRSIRGGIKFAFGQWKMDIFALRDLIFTERAVLKKK